MRYETHLLISLWVCCQEQRGTVQNSDKKEQQCTFETLLPTGPMLLISAFNTDKK